MYHIIENVLNVVKGKLPEQGPLEFFVHHNTLHHFEYLDFYEATKKAAFEYNSHAFMSEYYYIDEYHKGNIAHDMLSNACEKTIKKYQLKISTPFLIDCLLSQKSGTNTLSTSAKALQERYYQTKNIYFDRIYQTQLGIDITYQQRNYILRFFSAYFDYGASYWAMPNRTNGLWHAFCSTFKKPTVIDSFYLKKLSQFIKENASLGSENIILNILQRLNMEQDKIIYEEYLFSLAIRFKGWGGFIKSIGKHTEWIQRSDIVPSFTDFICILLVCEYIAISTQKRKIDAAPLTERVYNHSNSFITNFDKLLHDKSSNQEVLIDALPYLTDKNREEIWHMAFENTYYQQCVDVFATFQKRKPAQSVPCDFQVICCIDDREESFRRYLEANPACETFGYAGHFDLNIAFKGYFDKYPRSLCPIGSIAEYQVIEKPVAVKKGKLKALVLLGELQWVAALSSKRLLSGFLNTLVGFFTQILPLSLDIISPKLTSRIRENIVNHIDQIVATELVYKKEDIASGIPFDKAVEISKKFIETIGIKRHFSKFIFIMGHGSSSLNNPHEAAYDCGACGGGRGGPNARLMAKILNDPLIRQALQSSGVFIPENTVFIGAYHNTCSDKVILYDREAYLGDDIFPIINHINRAAIINAKERCRRFMMIPYGKNPSYYSKKAYERSIDLRQPRPECGHATNGVCIIGPREYTKDIFYDRTAFLISYDPHHDADAANLHAVLCAVIPVCAGINLEYYFSFIDSEFYGCGTKLPHNITSLVGVMNGFLSDLQLGLPWQMVEIHKPVRLFTLVVSRLPLVIALLNSQHAYTQIIENNWMSFYVFNIDDQNLYHFEAGTFTKCPHNDASKFYDREDDSIFNTYHACRFGLIR